MTAHDREEAVAALAEVIFEWTAGRHGSFTPTDLAQGILASPTARAALARYLAPEDDSLDVEPRPIGLERLADHLADVCGPQPGADWEAAARGLEFLLLADDYHIVKGAHQALLALAALERNPE